MALYFVQISPSVPLKQINFQTVSAVFCTDVFDGFLIKIILFFFFRSWRQNLIAFLFVCSFPPIDHQRNIMVLWHQWAADMFAPESLKHIEYLYIFLLLNVLLSFGFFFVMESCGILVHTSTTKLWSSLLSHNFSHSSSCMLPLQLRREITLRTGAYQIFQERFSSSCAAVKRNRQLDLVEVLGLDSTRLDTFLHPFPVPHHHVNEPFAEHCRCWLRVKKKFYFKIKYKCMTLHIKVFCLICLGLFFNHYLTHCFFTSHFAAFTRKKFFF